MVGRPSPWPLAAHGHPAYGIIDGAAYPTPARSGRPSGEWLGVSGRRAVLARACRLLLFAHDPHGGHGRPARGRQRCPVDRGGQRGGPGSGHDADPEGGRDLCWHVQRRAAAVGIGAAAGRAARRLSPWGGPAGWNAGGENAYRRSPAAAALAGHSPCMANHRKRRHGRRSLHTRTVVRAVRHEWIESECRRGLLARGLPASADRS
jgi:hypothetical protein